ncbi:MAG TPA: VOC family protein [Candidatus Limnocylindria bacterium]|jgi:catechol 2,3-dioxygenase-like lactoylglutathione lyase family enzyme|nr:VOC family protein [Candidatus Limnocylindria bacterium]
MTTGRIVAVGHVGLGARDLEALARFYKDTVGLKQSVYYAGVVAIFEVGDADVFLAPGEPGPAEFDLAADDVDALRARLVDKGVSCTDASDNKRTGHRQFAFTDPDGNQVRVLSAHRRD